MLLVSALLLIRLAGLCHLDFYGFAMGFRNEHVSAWDSGVWLFQGKVGHSVLAFIDWRFAFGVHGVKFGVYVVWVELT